jgi:hypothetical protein
LRPRLWRGVTLQLFLVAILPLTVLVIVVTFGSLELHHRAMRSLVADRNLLAVQSAAAGLGKAITNRSETLALVPRWPARVARPARSWMPLPIAWPCLKAAWR